MNKWTTQESNEQRSTALKNLRKITNSAHARQTISHKDQTESIYFNLFIPLRNTGKLKHFFFCFSWNLLFNGYLHKKQLKHKQMEKIACEWNWTAIKLKPDRTQSFVCLFKTHKDSLGGFETPICSKVLHFLLSIYFWFFFLCCSFFKFLWSNCIPMVLAFAEFDDCEMIMDSLKCTSTW